MSAKNDLLIKYLFELVVVRETRSLSIFEIISQRLLSRREFNFPFRQHFVRVANRMLPEWLVS